MITGRGRYVDDMVVPGMLYMAVVRSPEAHAKIVSIDTSGAKEQPGVHGVFTGEDLDLAAPPADGLGAAGRRGQDARALAARQGRGQVRRPGASPSSRRRQVRASSTPPSRCSSSTTRCRSSSIPRRRSRTARRSCHADARHQPDARVVDRRRRHGRGLGRGRRRDRAADRQPPHGRRADRAARAASPTTAAATLTLHLTSQNPHLIRLFMAGELGHRRGQHPRHRARTSAAASA